MKVHEKNPSIFFLNEITCAGPGAPGKTQKVVFEFGGRQKWIYHLQNAGRNLAADVYISNDLYLRILFICLTRMNIFDFFKNLCQVVGKPETGISCFNFHSGPNLFEFSTCLKRVENSGQRRWNLRPTVKA